MSRCVLVLVGSKYIVKYIYIYVCVYVIYINVYVIYIYIYIYYCFSQPIYSYKTWFVGVWPCNSYPKTHVDWHKLIWIEGIPQEFCCSRVTHVLNYILFPVAITHLPHEMHIRQNSIHNCDHSYNVGQCATSRLVSVGFWSWWISLRMGGTEQIYNWKSPHSRVQNCPIANPSSEIFINRVVEKPLGKPNYHWPF